MVVYVTDVMSAGGKAQGVAIPDNQNVIATYPIAVVKATKNQAAAQAFVDSMVSGEGQQALQARGLPGPVRRGRPPVGLLFPALVALALIVLPLVGLIQRAPWSSLGSQLSSPVVHQALTLSLRCSLSAVAPVYRARRAAGLAAGPDPLSGPNPGAGPGHPADGPAPGRRRRRPPLRLRPPGLRRTVARPADRSHAGVHDQRGHPGRDIRVAAISRHRGRSRLPPDRPALRGGGRHPRSRARGAGSGG